MNISQQENRWCPPQDGAVTVARIEQASWIATCLWLPLPREQLARGLSPGAVSHGYAPFVVVALSILKV